MSKHIHIHLERRSVRDKQALIYYRDVPEKEFGKYQIGQSYTFGAYKGKVIGKRRGEISGLPQVLVEWADAMSESELTQFGFSHAEKGTSYSTYIKLLENLGFVPGSREFKHGVNAFQWQQIKIRHGGKGWQGPKS